MFHVRTKQEMQGMDQCPGEAQTKTGQYVQEWWTSGAFRQCFLPNIQTQCRQYFLMNGNKEKKKGRKKRNSTKYQNYCVS